MSTRRTDKSLLASLAAKGQRAPRIHLRRLEGEMEPGKIRTPENRYELVEEIDSGAMGIIVRARDEDVGRDVAIKVLRPQYASRPEVVQRFVEEAQIGGQLQHPGLVPVYEIGVLADGRPYFAMKLVKGRTLKSLLDGRADAGEDRGRLLRIFGQICDAMAYAHARGVVHRDLKPSNILTGAFGEVQVVDWGLAKVLSRGGVEDDRRAKPRPPDNTIVETVRSEGSEYPSIEGVVMGTPEYMPPEQAMGEIDGLDERADVFALGAILCQILTGVPPYDASSSLPVVQAARGALDEAFERLDVSDADSEIVSICKRCLAPDRIDRPRNASRLAKLLSDHGAAQERRAQEVLLGAVAARAAADRVRAEAGQAEAEAKARRRARLQTIAIAIVVLLVLLAGGGGYLLNIEARQDRIERTEAKVHVALREARQLQGQEAWADAVGAARRGVELAETAEVGGDTAARARSLLSTLAAEYERVERDQALRDALATAKERWGHSMDARDVDDAYAKAFADYGIEVTRLEDEPYLAPYRESEMARELAEGLMTWAWLRFSRREVSDRPQWPLVFGAGTLDPDRNRTRIRLALAARDEDALTRFVHASAYMDVSTEMLAMVGLALARAGKLGIATAMLNRAVAAHPGDVWLRVQLGTVLYLAGARKAAARCHAAAVALRPESPMLNVHLGDALLGTGYMSEAILIYDRAIELDPATIRAYVGKGLCQVDANALDEAIATFEAAVAADPTASNPLWLLGDVYERQNRLTAAQAQYEKAIAVDPRNHLAHRSLGLLHLGKTRDYEAAVKAYREAVRLQPAHGQTQANLGSALLSAGRPLEAIPVLVEALELDPEYGFGHATLARAYWDLHRYAEAYPHIKWVTDRKLGLVPAGYDEVAKRLGAAEGRVDELRAGTYEPANATEWQTFGNLMYQYQRYVESTRYYAKGYEMDPELPLKEVARERYNAACAAALAGAGEGEDADTLDEADRAAHRAQSLEWMRAELVYWKSKHDAGEIDTPWLQRALLHWKSDSDLTGVRDAGIDALPADEASAWRAFWTDVDDTLR